MNAAAGESQLEEFLTKELPAIVARETTQFDELAAPWQDRLVIFGAGNLGRKTVAGLRRVGMAPLACADNSPALWNGSLDGVPILRPQEAADRFGKGAAFVIAVWSPGPERRIARLREDLESLGCRCAVSFVPLFWKHAGALLPHYRLDLPRKALAQADQVRQAFRLWADEASRREFLAQLRWMLSTDFPSPQASAAGNVYFPADLLTPDPQEVFVDCGAFDGDTIRRFLERRGGDFGRIIALEPDPSTFSKLETYAAALPGPVRSRIELLPLAVGAGRSRVRFEATGGVGSRVSGEGTVEVDCAALGEILGDRRASYIKLDVEGAEADALAGARSIVQRDEPALAVCIYHRQAHLWQIPLMLRSFSSRYHLFLRRHRDEFDDVVCYAVPPHRLAKEARS